MAQLGAVMEKREVPPSTGVSSASGGPRSTARAAAASPAPVESGPKKKPVRRASGAGAVTGILGVVCALLGVLAAPSLFLPLAVAFSVFALIRSLVAFSFAGMVAATLSCIFTVVGLVLFPWATYQGSKAATASSSTAAVIQTQNSAAPEKGIQPEPPKAAEPNAGGALSLPSAAPEQAAQPAKPEDGPPAASASSPPTNSEPQTKLEEALPTPPPPVATVVPDRATPPVAAEPPKPAVAEPPKPVMVEPPKPEVAEPAKPIVAPEPKPATAEPPKAAAAAPEPPKPAAEPPKSAAATDATKGNLQVWPENRTDQTRAIQILLRDLNFYHGTTNGTFGPGTRAAICLYLVTYDEKGECEPTKALFDSLQKRKASPNVGNAPR